MDPSPCTLTKGLYFTADTSYHIITSAQRAWLINFTPVRLQWGFVARKLSFEMKGLNESPAQVCRGRGTAGLF